MFAEADEMIRASRRRPTFIEASKDSWDPFREAISRGFSKGMESRDYSISKLCTRDLNA